MTERKPHPDNALIDELQEDGPLPVRAAAPAARSPAMSAAARRCTTPPASLATSARTRRIIPRR